MLISKFGETDKVSIRAALGEVPQELQLFLEKYNGGETPGTSFSADDGGSDIVGFYGIGKVKYSFSNVTTMLYDGKTFLPIAFDSFGNQIVISIPDGWIGFWNHENDSAPRRIAQSLKEFIHSANSSPIDPKHTRSVEEREKELIARGRGGVVTDALRNLWRAEIQKYSAMHQEPVVL